MHNLVTRTHNTLATQSIYHQQGRDHIGQSSKIYNEHDVDSEFQKIHSKEQNLKNDLAFWNGLAEGRLESIAGILNLFILMMIQSLGGKDYNGADSNIPIVLGWISIAQVCFAYLLIVIVKFFYVPKLQTDLLMMKSQGFTILRNVHKRKKLLAGLKLEELQVLLELLKQRLNEVRSLISKQEAQSYKNEISQLLNSHSHHQYQQNIQIRAIQEREKNAKYWQAFWQVFMLNKTYSIPGTIFLLLIIILASITKYSGQNIIAQGWIAIILWLASILIYIVIKQVLWDYLDEKVQKARSEPFVTYNAVYFNFKENKNYNLKQLEQLQEIIIKRSDQFETCFPRANSKELFENVQRLIKERLPQKKTQAQAERIREIVRKQKSLQTYHSTWINFFNMKAISTIINIQKFLIVMALSFVKKYPQTAEDIRNGQIVVGSLGIISFVFGHLFYWYLRCFGLQKMLKLAKQAVSQPFITFSLIYFGNKELKDLNAHQLQQINNAIVNKRDQFLNCFPNTNLQSLQTQLKQKMRQRVEIHRHSLNLSIFLKKQLQARERLAFWSNYCDGPLLMSIYSIYVLLVLLVVSIIAGNTGAASALGWVGVSVIGALIVMVLFFKCFFLEHLAASLKALLVPGISEFHFVYTKAKDLRSVQQQDLQMIIRALKANPDEFLRCFPQANIQNTLREIQYILEADPKPLQSQQIHLDIKIELQVQRLELVRNKNLFAIWSGFIKERLYVILPIVIVIYILWVQTIATTLYGLTVCGFLTVAFLTVSIALILFYNLWYRQYLSATIKKNQSKIRLLQNELHH